ncbi:hypothetical protein F939_02262 [Acinetobacter radioresistens DSM 6976 = NBRC 102413 = CIP 103788]|uniref:hypothetical protein n=1 Tax=Acinetobacter radioresistens TaxID=40216 RepID=UPI00028E7AF8|nr:hypothetical protein [Acinetobacter radioresistens]ENV87478.1 hypothetical protein F939_02262 [Acinetobacter radioresistens DSM 6976 = NBRC 102413 = CIP 103788]BBL21109.1 hypothetical protein ACRAD_17800 [Acinetobacter radioresistens DSM 6976 = NBRC 102413 = CIP 103788]
MAIETKNLVLYKSERLSDTEDGGGKYSGQMIEDGQSNNLFNDVSELDRTMGDVSLRKLFPAVTTNDTDLLMGATVFISENPKDPNVSALLFSTKSWIDERKSAQNRIENYLAKGGQAAGSPLDTHYAGMKTLQVAMFPSEVESSVGSTLVLVSKEGQALQHEQYVRITKVETRIAKMIIDDKEVEYKIATYSINDPLDQDYVGLSAKQWYSGDKSQTILRDTIVADTGKYYASSNLKSAAKVGEFTVNAESIFAQLVPSAQTETPIVDVNAAGESMVLVPGNTAAITATYLTTIGTAQNLYIGSSVMPSSMSFNLFGQQITDQGGLLKNMQGTQVGTIDYQRGVIQWTQAAGAGSANLSITFKPASAPNQYFQSETRPVTQQNQSANWTGVLVPPPAPGSLSVSYMSQGKFYELKDDGSGRLSGSSASFGSGNINYETGSWSITTGALPDVNTPILLLWGTPLATFIRSGLAVEPAAFEFDLQQAGIASGSVTVKWLLEGKSMTATTNTLGQFSGDATGTFNYASGQGRLVPNKLPQKNTVFTINYSYGVPLDQIVENVMPTDQKLKFTIGSGAAIQPNSVELSVPVADQIGSVIGTVVLTDIPVNAEVGNLVNSQGKVQGTITYATGAVEIIPEATSSVFTKSYIPTAVYGAA